jgi:hypothetical protein
MLVTVDKPLDKEEMISCMRRGLGSLVQSTGDKHHHDAHSLSDSTTSPMGSSRRCVVGTCEREDKVMFV